MLGMIEPFFCIHFQMQYFSIDIFHSWRNQTFNRQTMQCVDKCHALFNNKTRDVLFKFHLKFWNTTSIGIPARSLL